MAPRSTMRAVVARTLGWLTFLLVAFGAPPIAVLVFEASTATTFSIGFGGLIVGGTLGAVVDYYLAGGAAAPRRPEAQVDHGPPSFWGVAVGLLILNGAGALACGVLFLPWFPVVLMIFYAIVGGLGFGAAATGRFGLPMLLAGLLGVALGIASYFGGRYLVVAFGPAAAIETPSKARKHPDARIFELASGRPRPDLGFGTHHESMDGYTTYTAVVPIVDDDWTADARVPMWAACRTTAQYGKFSMEEWVDFVREGCDADWNDGSDSMRLYFDDADGYADAFAHAKKQGLRSKRRAPLVTWLGSRDDAASSDRTIFVTSAIAANAIWLIAGPLLIFLARRKHGGPRAGRTGGAGAASADQEAALKEVTEALQRRG